MLCKKCNIKYDIYYSTTLRAKCHKCNDESPEVAPLIHQVTGKAYFLDYKTPHEMRDMIDADDNFDWKIFTMRKFHTGNEVQMTTYPTSILNEYNKLIDEYNAIEGENKRLKEEQRLLYISYDKMTSKCNDFMEQNNKLEEENEFLKKNQMPPHIIENGQIKLFPPESTECGLARRMEELEKSMASNQVRIAYTDSQSKIETEKLWARIRSFEQEYQQRQMDMISRIRALETKND